MGARRTMSYVNNIKMFVRVYELGSMSAAARDQRTSPAVASARISELEKHLGLRLFNRTTRSLQPTENGRIFYEGARKVLEAIDEAEAAVVNATQNPRGTIFVAAPLGIGRRFIAPHVPAFKALYPQIDLRLRLSDRHVDVTAEGLDLAFHLGLLDDSTLKVRLIADCPRVLCAAPAYIAEIAPAAQRGRLVALFQTNIVIGILVAFVSNYLLGGMGEDDWRWMLGAEVLPALAYLAACFIIPESPRWLVTRRGDVEAARAVLIHTDPDGAEATLAAIQSGEGEERRLSLSAFFSAKYARVIGLAVAIAFFNQVSGINAIIYYAPRIFESAGQGQSAALLATTGIGVVNLIATIAGMLLIDRMGRRWLMTVGSVGYIGSLLMVAYGFWSGQFALVPIFIFAFIAAHAIGQGAVIWVFISEIFPNEARAQGQALGASTHWVLAAALTLIMPAVLESVPPVAIFLSFAAMMAVQLIWVRMVMPETKGQSLEDLRAA